MQASTWSKVMLALAIAASTISIAAKGEGARGDLKVADAGISVAGSAAGNLNKPPSVASNQKAVRVKTVLSARLIHGHASVGYASARACPEVLDKLFCYCGCDLSVSHNTLLDCFTSDHGAYCDDCQEEAILGQKLHNGGVSMKEIQKAVDQKFSSHYPFRKPSPRYQNYLDSRLYVKHVVALPMSAKHTASSKEQNAAPASADFQLKQGKLRGKCCGGEKNGVQETKNMKQAKSNDWWHDSWQALAKLLVFSAQSPN